VPNKVTSTFRDVLTQAVSEIGDSQEVGKDGQRPGNAFVVANKCEPALEELIREHEMLVKEKGNSAKFSDRVGAMAQSLFFCACFCSR
jgi:hypothetical protein